MFADSPERSGVVSDGTAPDGSRALPRWRQPQHGNFASALQQGAGVAVQVAGCGGAAVSNPSLHHDDEMDCGDDTVRDDTPPFGVEARLHCVPTWVSG